MTGTSLRIFGIVITFVACVLTLAAMIFGWSYSGSFSDQDIAFLMIFGGVPIAIGLCFFFLGHAKDAS